MFFFCANYFEDPTVEEAVYNNGESVEAVACETAMLCFLLHHMTLLDIDKKFFMSSMKLSHHDTYKIQGIVKKV